MNPEPIRILIADDHAIVREGLSAIVRQQGDMEVVGQAHNGRDLVEQHAQLRPDITLVDIRMPELDGIKAISEIRTQAPKARFIVLTQFDDDEDIYRSMRAGAQAYLLKGISGDELVEAITAVHSGQRRLPPSVAATLAEHLANPQLTVREREILTLMAKGHSNKEIATALFVTPGTVKAHIHSILGKLGANDRTQAVTTALRRGLVVLN